MKITIFSAKGSAGKTPLSVNIALDREYAIATNETYHVLDKMFPDERLIAVAPNESFPIFPDDIDVVFDLGGAIGGDSAKSIRSAVIQSDVVIIPVYNEYKAINGAYHTILEVQEINTSILLVCTKLEKKRHEIFEDWSKARDFIGITAMLSTLTGKTYPALPLKLSKGFDAIFDHEISLRQMVNGGGIDAYTYRVVAEQFEDIYRFLDNLK